MSLLRTNPKKLKFPVPRVDLLVSNTLPGYKSFSRSLSPTEISLASRGDPIEMEDDTFVEGDAGETNDDEGVFDGESWRLAIATGASGGLPGFVMLSNLCR